MELPATFYVHRMAVQPLLGSGPYGDSYGDPVEVPCWINHTRRLVRNVEGEEVVSEATVALSLDFLPQTAPGSLLTLHTELYAVPLREATVIGQAPATDGGLGAWQHLQLTVG